MEWQPIETAPNDRRFLAVTEVWSRGEFSYWVMHVVWLDDETGDIANECESGWRLSDYTHWMPLPPPPASK